MTNFPLSDLLGKTAQGNRALRFKGEVENSTEEVIFQNAAIAPSNGTEFTVGAYKNVTIEIYGTSTTRTVVFEATGLSGVFRPIIGVKTDDLAMATQTIGNNESWSFDITGQSKFRVRILDVSGGNITIKGTAVS